MPDPPQPNTPHGDHVLLRETIHAIAADFLKKLLWFLFGVAMALGVIGFNIWLQLRDTVKATELGAKNTAELSKSFKDFRDKQEPFNEKTSIMWHQGEWKRFKTNAE